MSKTFTIELPDDIAQQLGVATNAVEAPLQKLILDTLNTLSELRRSLQNDNLLVRASAVKKLGELGIEAAIPDLAQALKDRDHIVKAAAVDALRKIGTEDALSIIGQNQHTNRQNSTNVPSLMSLAGTLKIGTIDLGENHDRYTAEDLEQELSDA
jgi:HEAT repeat protein